MLLKMSRTFAKTTPAISGNMSNSMVRKAGFFQLRLGRRYLSFGKRASKWVMTFATAPTRMAKNNAFTPRWSAAPTMRPMMQQIFVEASPKAAKKNFL